ncbi:MAG: hypothetical protein AB7G75_17055 [Candidatus Binatia bacterium]
MKGNLKHWYGNLATVGVVVGLMASSLSPVYAGNANPRIIPPHAKAHGMTYGEWSAKWWQWAYSLPVDQNPWFDEKGSCANGANGQFGPVWFLTGVINESGTAVRNCTVPVGKAFFFPIINAEDATLESGLTGEDLREFPTFAMSLVTKIAAEIDGVPVENLYDYRAVSPLFVYGPLPDNNVLAYFGFDAPAGSTNAGAPPNNTFTPSAAADGYYLMLAPLSAGQHTIHFTGTFGDPVNFTLDITYNLTVVPGKP